MSKIVQFSTKKLLIFILAGFIIYYLASRWVGLPEIQEVINKANPGLLLLALLAELIAYLGTAYLLKSIFAHLKITSIKLGTFFKLATITVVSIHSLPVSAFGEAAFSYYFLRKLKVKTGSILAMLVTRIIFSYSAFFVLLSLSLLAMPAMPDVSLAGKIASIILFLLLIIGIIYARNLYLNFQRFRRVVGRIINLLDRVKKSLLKKSVLDDSQKESVIHDIHQGFSPFDSPKLFIKQASIGAIYWIFDLTCLFLVLYSLGFMVNPIKLVIAYGVATTLGAISLIPGGLGVLEGTLGLMLVNIGVPIDITVLGVMGYRLLSFWLLIPIGIISMISLNQNGSKKAD